MNDLQYNPLKVVAALDAIQFLSKYSDYITKEEGKKITYASGLVQDVMRRVLKKHFAGFNIRKNMREYSLKCTDEDIYAALYAARTIVSNRRLMDRFSPSIREKLSALQSIVEVFNHRNGIRHVFKTDNKFFFYISFTHDVQYYNYTEFDRYSLTTRMEAFLHNIQLIREVQLDPILKKIATMLSENSIYSVYDDSIVPVIDEEFIDYYMQYENRVYNIKSVYIDFDKMKNERDYKVIAEETEPLLVVDVHTPGERVVYMNPTEALPMHEQTPPTQGLSGLRLVPVEERQSESSQRTSGLEGLRLIEIGTFELDIYDVIRHIEEQNMSADIRISDYEYLLYLQQAEADMDFTATDIDLYDDTDSIREGLYVDVEPGEEPQLVYTIYDSNEEIFRTYDYEEAKAGFVRHFGTEPSIIKYSCHPDDYNDTSINM